MEGFVKAQPDLVLLDINLPYYDGYFLCRSIRQQSTVPIIIISARSTEMDQIMAIELGADDYITKPFTFDLLHTKVKATMRRVYGEYAGKDSGSLAVGSLKINSPTLAAYFGEKREELSKNEYILLKKLMEQHNTYIPRETLIEEVWDSLTFVDDNTLTVNMTRIKQKLSSLGLPKVITSKRGVGYMLSVPTELGKTNG
jgi:DNA-binding response OmpR family regulator